MKKLLGILLSVQVALLVLFSLPSQAQARWGNDSYDGSYGNHMYWSRHHGMNNWDNWGNSMSLMPLITNNPYVVLYKLGVDVALSILFILFFSKLIMRVFTRMAEHPFKNGYVGFTFLIIFPLISIILLGLLWLGIAGLLTYGLIFLAGLFLMKVFIGWSILRKLEKGYVLDWKAGLAGPLVVFILLLIPVLGWIVLAVILAMATGAFLKELMPLLERQNVERKTTKK